MSHRPAPLRLTADRRAREGGAGTPSYAVRGPVSGALGRGGPASRPAPTGLTRRERRVKAILLKELETLSGTGTTWTSYQERKKLFDTLDIAFIDREIEKMRKQLRPRPWLVGLGAVFGVAYVGLRLAPHVGEPLSWFAGLDVLITLLLPVAMVSSFVFRRKATRRRLWIYQALRELSDAEDEGVQLDESVRLADLLIDRILDAEETAAPAPLHRIRT